MPDVVAIIQARMGSTRLPGKVLMPMAGVPMLERVIRQVKQAKSVDEIIVAIPRFGEQAAIVDLCQSYVVTCWAHGDDDDVLGRYASANSWTTSDFIVRICGDMPLVRPDLIDDCVERLQSSLCHYVHYTLPTGEVAIETKRGVYPEAFTARALRHANEHVLDASDREHVTPVMRRQPEYNPWLVQLNDDDGLNCAVDTQEDFDRVEQIIMEREAVLA